MSPELREVYFQLADGRRHNGAELADVLGVSRAAVWKRIQALRKLGLPVSGTAGSGYRVDTPIEVLDEARLKRHLGGAPVEVELAGAVDSTNARLAAHQPFPHRRALAAEAQTAGRGRRGRGWQSPLGGGIYLSLAWRFECGLSGLSALSLVVGMTAAEAIREVTGVMAAVKWPNDLVFDGAKLGGCLVEISGAAEGPCQAVAGIGLNTAVPAGSDIDQTYVSLAELTGSIERNRLTAELIANLADRLERLESEGFEPFRERWKAHDALYGKPVQVLQADGSGWNGRAEGIDEHGALQVRTRQGLQSVNAGEVSVRER